MFTKLLGIFLVVGGIYFLAQNIVFYPYYYNNIWTTASVLSIICGTISLLFFHRETGNLSWILLGMGIVVFIFNGGVLFRPISLWNLLVSLAALATGYKLLTEGKVRF